MSDEKQKFSRTGTGTVPKIKYRNNNPQINQRDFHRNVSNNFDLSWQRQPSRNFYQTHPYQMDATVQEDRRQIDILSANMPVVSNGTSSAPSTSGSTSRRESVGTIPKCDNVKKCPDKKQIEDKLNQIREYLQVTTSLMSSIKNNDDQSAVNEREQFEKMIKDLKDSEKKLLDLVDDPLFLFEDELDEVVEENHNMDVAVSEHMQKFSQLIDILACQQDKFINLCNTNQGVVVDNSDNVIDASGYQRNELEEKVEFTNRKVQLLKEQQNALINLKMKAENQLRDARLAQENLLLMQQSQKSANQIRNGNFEHENQARNVLENPGEITLKGLSDKLQQVKQAALIRPGNQQINEDYLQEPYDLQLLQVLDNRDVELNCEHLDLQHKFNDIQSKKLQIDQLADQLQTLGDDDDEDIGHQVRKIVTMKQQLSSLKDLLEVVKSTEYSLSELPNVNGIISDHENVPVVNAKKENNRQEGRKRNQNERRLRLENNAQSNSNEHLVADKQSNKSLLKMQEQEKVLAELKAKKKELEEIMYKQKDRTSINNDVFSETSVNKSDLSTNNVFENVSSWLPAQQPQHNHAYSSDDCPEEDINEYSDLNSATDINISIPQPQPLLNSNYSTSTYGKRHDSFPRRFDGGFNADYIQHSSPHTSEQCLPSATPLFESRRTSTNPTVENESNRSQVQKQLELIQSVCQSILDQQSSNNVHQLRNNLTPSPRPYITPNVRQTLTNPMMEPLINPQFTPQYFAMNEVTNNQNMLTANTLQTQAFLLNTLNQCCQMLWFQQREIATLRNMICGMQNQMISEQPEQDLNQIPSTNPSYLFPNRPISSLSNFRSPTNQRNLTNVKTNQVSSACSLPNLNPLGVNANIENAYANHNNVVRLNPNARLLETTLNNTVPIHGHHNLGNEQSVNNMLGVNTNANIGQQIWNGPALNNQVAPGNRANNYWDNFRSYSRQNLLSTTSKSNEVLQNSPLSLAPGIDQHSNERPCLFPPTPPCTVPKLNLGFKESTNASEESTPRRQIYFKSSQNLENSNKPMAAVPPDVLNINHSSGDKINERQDLTSEVPFVATNLRPNRAIILERDRNFNENFDISLEFPAKSKLFEELRDNIYREVANLISTNVSRPHFLIQLFRDLQHINSDPLRRRTLQSIQQVVTNSLFAYENSRGANRQSTNGPQVNAEASSFFSQSTSQSPAGASQNGSTFENDDLEIGISQSVMDFFNLHMGDLFEDELIEVLKKLIIEDNPHVQVMMDSTNNLQKCCNDIFSDTWEKYKGKRIGDIKNELINTISTILMVDFSIMYVIQDHISNVRDNTNLSSDDTPQDNGLSLNLPLQTNAFVEEGSTPQMQNGDLAEADQSCIVAQEEEEGAVGGVINMFLENSYNNVEFADSSIPEASNVEIPINAEGEVERVEQGLDQVPTRLTTACRSHCNTSNRDDI